MPKKSVRDGAVLSCTLGSAKSKLIVSKSQYILIDSAVQATISDNVVGKNISNFCNCKRSQELPPCTPTILLKWQLANKNHTIYGDVALLEDCILPCLYGGIIKIENSGQTEK